MCICHEQEIVKICTNCFHAEKTRVAFAGLGYPKKRACLLGEYFQLCSVE